MNVLVFFFLCLLFVSAPGFAQSAEAVWVEVSKTTNSIVFTQLVEDEWLAPAVIHVSDNPLSQPTMATLVDGSKVMIWSEQQSIKSVLMIMRKDPNTNNWQTPQLFSAFGVENTGASMLVDLTGQLWVFWAANSDGLDDIYFVRGEAGSWTDPKQVNAFNEVPDHLPQSVNLQTGDVQLSWLSFNFVSLSYLTEKRVFELDVPPQLLVDSEAIKEELSLTDVSLPAQMNALQPGLVHFPDNRLVQNFLLDDHGR